MGLTPGGGCCVPTCRMESPERCSETSCQALSLESGLTFSELGGRMGCGWRVTSSQVFTQRCLPGAMGWNEGQLGLAGLGPRPEHTLLSGTPSVPHAGGHGSTRCAS